MPTWYESRSTVQRVIESSGMITDMNDTPISDFPLKHHLGMEIRAVEPGHSEAEITVDERHLNPNGVSHGSVVFAMIDTSMGAAVMSLVPDGKICTTTDIHMRYLRAVTHGRLIADTVVVKPGRTLMHLESKVRDDAGNVVASATGAFMILDAPSATRPRSNP